MAKSAQMVYNEWRDSLLRGFTDTDLNVCPRGSVFYLGLSDNKIKPLFVSRTIGGEMFHAWYAQYIELLDKAPEGVVPRYSSFYAVSPLDTDTWSADEFRMERIAGSDFQRPVLGARAYAKITLPSLESVYELCFKARNK